MTLLAGFQILLYRYTGQDDILVGSPIAGRTRPEVEGLIGFFVNTLVLRTDLSGEPTFRTLLGHVREAALGAYAHQDVPFEKLVEALQPQRSPSHSPMFQVMFILQNAPTFTLNLPGLRSTALSVDTGTAKFDLTLCVEDTEHGLRATLEYNTELFDGSTASRMLEHWQTLLEGAVACPDERVSHLPLLTEAERHQLFVEWNDTRAGYPSQACLHHLFEAQVDRTPEDIAVICGNQSLTYRELNRRANRVAHYLRERGVSREVLVGLCVERSLLMVEGLLGILKAGGAYVPLDPGYPNERLAFMFTDARPAVVTQQHLLSVLPEPAAAVAVCLDADAAAVAAQREDTPTDGTTPESLAYVLYTSGSTGLPKGVLGLHRGAVNRCAWMWRMYPFAPEEVCCQKTSLNFVDSVWELFGPLLAGVPSVIIPDDVLRDPQRLVHTIAAHGVSRIVLVPSLLKVLLETTDGLERRLPDLRLWIASGEALAVELADRFRRSLPQGILLNLYGCSEAAGDSTYYDTSISTAIPFVPIGRPIANTQIYLLDRHLEPVPMGVRGELYVGGDGLARGYVNRPELTTERFITAPLGARPGVRLYRTGDLARYLNDGNIEFLGRTDQQVKIRGHRIELGEIETLLGGHPAVREAVVLARDDTPGERQLVAYLVLRRAHTPTNGELRRFLQEKLPEFMVPSAFVLLDQLPMSPNGKVDRRTLPAPDQTIPPERATRVAPREFVELQLTRIWEKVLGVRGVGVQDNFFDLGGHSLLGVRLFAQIEEVLGKRLPLATLFRAPTVEQLARLVREDGGVGPLWSSLVAIQPDGSKPPLFCVHHHLGHVLCYHDLARALGPDRPVYGLQARGLDGIQEPWARVEDMAAQYVREVRDLQPEGPYFLAGYCFGGIVAYEIAQQLRSDGQTVALLALLDPWYPRRSTALCRLRRRIERGLADLAPLTPRMRVVHLLQKALKAAKTEASRIARTLSRKRPLDHLGKVEEAHVRAARAYVPQPYAGQVTLFFTRLFAEEPDAGWREIALGGLTVCEVPGDHVVIHEEPRVHLLAERLRNYLDAA